METAGIGLGALTHNQKMILLILRNAKNGIATIRLQGIVFCACTEYPDFFKTGIEAGRYSFTRWKYGPVCEQLTFDVLYLCSNGLASKTNSKGGEGEFLYPTKEGESLADAVLLSMDGEKAACGGSVVTTVWNRWKKQPITELRKYMLVMENVQAAGIGDAISLPKEKVRIP